MRFGMSFGVRLGMSRCVSAALVPAMTMLVTFALWIGGIAVSAAQGDGAYVRPYGPNAPWNRPVRDASGALVIPAHPESERYSRNFWLYAGSRPGDCNVNPGYTGYTYPVYDASTATGVYPVETVYDWANLRGFSMPWNPEWLPASGTDGQVIVIDPTTGLEWNLWQVRFEGGVVKASNANVVLRTETNVPAGTDPYPLAGNYFTKENGFRPSRGVGIQYLAMLVRPEEIHSGAIRHAFSVPIRNPSKTHFVPPATKLERQGADTGIEIPEGMRFALNVTDAEIEEWLASLPEDLPNREATVRSARIVARAMRDYGWFVTDTSGGCHFQFEDVHTAGDDWIELGLGYRDESGGIVQFVSQNGKTYPRDLLDGLLAEDRIIALVPSDAYPPLQEGDPQ